MAHIKIQSTHPSLLKAMICIALEREKKLLCDAIDKTQFKIDHLQRKYGLTDLDKLLEGATERTDENEMDLVALEGELHFLMHLQQKLESIQEMKISEN